MFKLYRHGTRSPTTNAGIELQRTLKKFKSADKVAAGLQFIKDYVYTLGENELLPFGAAESVFSF
jgi:hypothetical protein